MNTVDFNKDAIERELREIFQGCGDIIRIHLSPDRDTGNLKGFGFVTFSNLRGADKAITNLDGTLVMGRRITVQGANQTAVVRFPENQQRLECMKCAGFIRSKKGGEVRGTYFPWIINWDLHDILSFYSRMMEAFGCFNSTRRHHMKTSLARTLASKYKYVPI